MANFVFPAMASIGSYASTLWNALPSRSSTKKEEIEPKNVLDPLSLIISLAAASKLPKGIKPSQINHHIVWHEKPKDPGIIDSVISKQGTERTVKNFYKLEVANHKVIVQWEECIKKALYWYLVAEEENKEKVLSKEELPKQEAKKEENKVKVPIKEELPKQEAKKEESKEKVPSKEELPKQEAKKKENKEKVPIKEELPKQEAEEEENPWEGVIDVESPIKKSGISEEKNPKEIKEQVENAKKVQINIDLPKQEAEEEATPWECVIDVESAIKKSGISEEKNPKEIKEHFENANSKEQIKKIRFFCELALKGINKTIDSYKANPKKYEVTILKLENCYNMIDRGLRGTIEQTEFNELSKKMKDVWDTRYIEAIYTHLKLIEEEAISSYEIDKKIKAIFADMDERCSQVDKILFGRLVH